MHLVAVGIAQVSTRIAFAVVRAFAGFAFTAAARQQAGGVGALDRQLIGGEKGQHAAVAGAGGLSVEGLVGIETRQRLPRHHPTAGGGTAVRRHFPPL